MLRRHFLKLSLAIGGLATTTTQAWARLRWVRSGAWLEVRKLRGKAIYQSGKRKWRAWVGLRFQDIGDVFETAENTTAELALQSGIGTVYVSEKTKFYIKQRSKTKDGGLLMQLYIMYGQIRVKVRPFVNPSSRLDVITPAGIAGVRGTEFGVGIQPSGQTGVATKSGLVEVLASGQSVNVGAAKQSLVVPNSPPGAARPLRDNPGLYITETKFDGKQVQLIGYTDPVNVLLIEGVPQTTTPEGAFNYLISQWKGNVIRVKVITPLGTYRRYELPVID